MDDFDDEPAGGFYRDPNPRDSRVDPEAAFHAASTTQNSEAPPPPPQPVQGGGWDLGAEAPQQQQQGGAYPTRGGEQTQTQVMEERPYPAQGQERASVAQIQMMDEQPKSAYPERQAPASNAWGTGGDGGGAPAHRVHNEAPRERQRDHFGGEDEILEIPALDEEEEEDITKQVAEPTQGHALQLKNVSDLGGLSPSGGRGSLINRLDATNQDGVDLSVLMKGLCRAQVVCDVDDAADQTWNPETLLQQTLSEFTALQNPN